MFESAIEGLNATLNQISWVSELAGILPLSALIEFIDIPPKLHIYQLAGSAALWNSPITPAGSRLLLSDDNFLQPHCYLDRYGNSINLLGLDGRYGSRYYVSSPETIRLCIQAHRARVIENSHENIRGDDLRLQNLDIIHVSRLQPREHQVPKLTRFGHVFPRSPRMRLAHLLGWIVLLAMIVMSVILRTYLSFTFLILMPVTGGVLFALHGSNPRGLLVHKATRWNRLILVAEHENTTDWVAFYGEATILNSLINRPLKPLGSVQKPASYISLRVALRVLILGQWALALGAAATKDWNAYFITFWISFCIFMQAYVMPPERGAKEWMKSYAGIRIERYHTQLSSRRALLNTIIALNPDSFSLRPGTQQEDRSRFSSEAMKWIDPILGVTSGRERWEEATLKAMNHAVKDEGQEGKSSRAEWEEEYKKDFWAPFIMEGIYMADKIKEQANLPGRTNEDVRKSEV
ncbi:uncharacterized protein F4807DRAFT_236774 [Annulohypoxylon truncatum]|uniref:uncharacterized protein n=1 Tax=Annulohypoxylon truncatum TaxID=327061 RepID=UPI0020072656|nr:uncharacterized protein F4807DRAFT_236774 [Annulohypoxylon truncatum]KAI1206346.1 hypothetical protein F4807DRAFT_236774 [Annulohypoxylon truncatum]